MVLLVVLGVGLLSLSSLSLSSARQSSALAEARANARLALSMAIAQLQEHTGPDQRITATADILAEGADGSTTAAAEGRRHWTGVYNSWSSTSTTRPTPEFRSWLVSGEENEIESENSAKSSASSDDAIELVGTGTIGDALEGRVTVPTIQISSPRGKSRVAWWTGDQGVKAALSSRQRDPAIQSIAAVRSNMQTATRQAVEIMSAGTSKPFEDLDPTDPRIQFVADWKNSALLASDHTATQPLFHDVAPFSSGLLTNVRAGGFRRDLSMELERAANRAPDPTRTALYRVNNESGINLQELWAYYTLPSKLGRTTATFTTGGRVASGTPKLEVASGPSNCQNDDHFFFKQPVIIAYQLALSFETRPTQVTVNGTATTVDRLHVVADPILTFWNPLDIPVVMPTASFMSVKYWQIPYDFYISVNGAPAQRYPSIASLSSGDLNYLSLRAGEAQQLVFKPGEVIKVSQSGNLNVKTTNSNDHNLVGRSGFNFGGGVSLPVRDAARKELDLKPGDTFTYELRPNNLTAGKTSSSGGSLTGANAHTRHFSMTHHEYYIGADRGANSLGIGGMYIDYDFGNRRLRATETRTETQPGTKPSSERLYADRFPDVFPMITKSQGRPLNSTAIRNTKAPFALLSYHAKTEGTNDIGTRTLARFNPKALHVDFYDLSQRERDMLPYEFTVYPLVSWKNRHIEVSTNGGSFFGGGMNAELGVPQVSTHSIPREPITSLAAFQHSFANGFEMQKPKYGYAALNAREPMLPQVSHAIGNSMAPSMLSASQTQGSLSGGRPLADHSYLANLALFDDWFLSGIAPRTSTTFGSGGLNQRAVADQFINGTGELPTSRYLPNIGSEDPARLLASLFTGANPSTNATNLTATLIRVDGMFNVNSTSVEAWKALLASTREQSIVVRDEGGVESITTPKEETTPVAGLFSPYDSISDGSRSTDLKEPGQWAGRRELTDEQIQALAEAIVREVRKRGPFLSLADFVNRRPGNDKELARAGAIQSALDDSSVPINASFNGSRGVPSTSLSRFAFPDAEEGPASYGIPGIVKQADILTPIAPILSARSDSFIIRAYGESRDASGKILARAWCEAVVERERDYFDTEDKPEIVANLLSKDVNKSFGRRYGVVSFRWLHPEEV